MLIHFFSLNISDFSLLLSKNCTPPETFHPHLLQQPPSENCDHVKLPPPFSFKKFVGDWTPQQKWRGSHYISVIYNTYLETQKVVIFGLQLCPSNHKNCRYWNLKTHISSDNPISMWLQWIWNSAFWLEVENLRKLEIIFSYKPLPSLSQENRKTLPSALLDTSTK